MFLDIVSYVVSPRMMFCFSFLLDTDVNSMRIYQRLEADIIDAINMFVLINHKWYYRTVSVYLALHP